MNRTIGEKEISILNDTEDVAKGKGATGSSSLSGRQR